MVRRSPKLQARIEAWATSGITALNAIAASPRARRNVDIPTVSYMLSALFWRLLDAQIADRRSRGVVADAGAASRHVLFEDPPPDPDE